MPNIKQYYSILFVIGFYIIIKLYEKYKEKKSKTRKIDTESTNTIKAEPIQTEATQEEPIQTKPIQDAGEYKNKYQKRYLLTKNEYQEYKKLKHFADIKGFIICPKVRLLDLIEPRKGDPKQKTYLYKIQSKHVDFVICDQNLYIKAILELDDNSHNQTNRKERDDFVDLILRDVGYTVIRTRSVTETTLDQIS